MYIMPERIMCSCKKGISVLSVINHFSPVMFLILSLCFLLSCVLEILFTAAAIENG